MRAHHLSFTVSFGLVALIVILVEAFAITELRIFLNPVPSLFLAGYLYSNTRLSGKFSKMIFGGVLFFLTGNLLWVLSANTGFFQFVCLALLVGNIFYGLAFSRDYRTDVPASKNYGNVAFIAMAIFNIGLYFLLMPNLLSLKLLLLAFFIVSTGVVTLAGYRYKRVSALNFNLIFSGVILLTLFSTVMMIVVFLKPSLNYTPLVSTFFIAGQYLVVLGSIERNHSKKISTRY